MAPDDGGSAISGYTVIAAPGGATTAVTADQTNATVTGLTNGQAYTFTVTATNANGTSAPSEPSNEVTPAGLPDAPAKPNVVLNDRTATITWETPSGNGSPITGYTITGTNNAGIKTVTAENTQVTFTGLTRAQTYTFTVTATNAVGDSDPSPPTDEVRTLAVPSPPTSVNATGGDQSASVTWTAPPSEAPITAYTVTVSPGGTTIPVAGDRTTTTVTGLTNETSYTFTVTATSSAGTSPPSDASNPITPQAVVTAACTQAQADHAEASADVAKYTTKLKRAKKQLTTAKKQLSKAKKTGKKAQIKRAKTKVKKAKNKVKTFTKQKRAAQTAQNNAQTRINQNC